MLLLLCGFPSVVVPGHRYRHGVVVTQVCACAGTAARIVWLAVDGGWGACPAGFHGLLECVALASVRLLPLLAPSLRVRVGVRGV